jgi:hypothetical protein
VEERLSTAVPWTPEVRWQKHLTFTAASYQTRSLFPVAPLDGPDIRMARPEHLATSPSGRWAYCEKVLARGEALRTFHGKQQGTVMFDGPVVLPSLHERHDPNAPWQREPWMSLTPMEVLTLRAGTRKARGRVVVAGLGLGHQLIEVSRRARVKELVLVEIDGDLASWLIPAIEPHLGQKVHTIIGDACDELPKLSADVALVDIFPTYGGNGWARDELRRACRNVGHLWCWGA